MSVPPGDPSPVAHAERKPGIVRRAFRDHPATVLGLLAAALVILRLVGVTGYHLNVALALLGAAGAANVLIGTAITLIPYFLPASAALALALALFAPVFAGHRRAALDVAALVLILAAEASPVFLLAFMISDLGHRGVVSTTHSTTGPTRYTERLGVGADADSRLRLATGLQLSVAPPEVVQIDGDRVFGYVVSFDGQWTTILQDADREVLIVHASAVASRTPCQLAPNALTVTLPELLRPRIGVPLCPMR